MDTQFIGALQQLSAAKLCEELKPWQIENGKAAFLDYLYALYERDSAEVGLRGTYTGLVERFKHDAFEIIRAGFISSGSTPA
jgi:hypothetical protein